MGAATGPGDLVLVPGMVEEEAGFIPASSHPGPLLSLLRTADLGRKNLELLLRASTRFRSYPLSQHTLLRGDTVTLYFNKPSTRTRLSFETAVARLGATPIGVGPHELQLDRGETIEDTARVISAYTRAFVIRTFADEDVARFARAATIPVINALTDGHHPCQSVADALTLVDEWGRPAGRRVAFVGDGDNVVHSLVEACALLGAHVAVATPPGREPNPRVIEHASRLAAENGGTVSVTNDPYEAVRGADAVYTDVWQSMGVPEDQREARVRAFRPYQVNTKLMAAAADDAIFMHCLPAHRGEEVTAEVIDGPRSRVFQQAANRLPTEQAILWALVTGVLQTRGET